MNRNVYVTGLVVALATIMMVTSIAVISDTSDADSCRWESNGDDGMNATYNDGDDYITIKLDKDPGSSVFEVIINDKIFGAKGQHFELDLGRTLTEDTYIEVITDRFSASCTLSKIDICNTTVNVFGSTNNFVINDATVTLGGVSLTNNGNGTYTGIVDVGEKTLTVSDVRGYEPYSEDVTVNSDEITVNLTPISYDISYSGIDGITGSNNNPGSYDIEDKVTLDSVEKIGYTFNGWYGSGTKTESFGPGVTGVKTFNAEWIPKNYEITVNPAGGTFEDSTMNKISATYDSHEYTLPKKIPVKEGYTFEGYYTAASSGIMVFDKTGVVQNGVNGFTDGSGNWINDGDNITLYAEWTLTKYTITYDLNGGVLSSPNPAEYTIESATFTLKNPTIQNGTFLGWTGTDLTEASEEVIIETGSFGSRTYTATWEMMPNSVIYDSEDLEVKYKDGEIIVSGTIVGPNTEVTLSVKDKTGYIDPKIMVTVNGATATEVKPGDYTVLGTTSFEVQRIADTYSITYVDPLEAQNGNPTTYTIESEVISLTGLQKEGYTFGGWFTDSKFENKVESIPTGSTGAKIFYAKWTCVISASVNEGGSISPSGNVDVLYGGKQTFTISANNGYHISDVKVDGISVGTVSSYEFASVERGYTISVTFAKNSPPGPDPPSPGPETVTIKASAGEGGSISPSGNVKVVKGNDVTFAITADKGYIISDVMVNGKSVGKVGSYTMSKVAADGTISVTFEKSIEPQPEKVPTSDDIEADLKEKDDVKYLVDANEMKDNASSSVSTDVLKGIPAGKSVTFTVMKDNVVEYAITFSADSSYVPDSKSIDLRIYGNDESSTEVEEAAKKAGSDKSFYLDLKASGKLPTDTTVKYFVGADYKAGDKVSLYYYNETTKEMESQNQTLTVDADLNVTFKISHASIYSLLDVPEESSNIMLYVIIAIVVVVAIIALAYFLMRSRDA